MRDAERRAPLPRERCTINLNREEGDWCCEWLDDLRHKHHILHDYPSVYALQETDNWTTSAMNVPSYIVYGNDHGKTVILCPREVNHFRRSWVDRDRCTAIMVETMMLLSVFLPHSGRDEEDYIEAFDTVRATLMEEKKQGAIDFFTGRDLNIEFTLDNVNEDLHCWDIVDWYGMYGPECGGGGEDRIAYEKN